MDFQKLHQIKITETHSDLTGKDEIGYSATFTTDGLHWFVADIRMLPDGFGNAERYGDKKQFAETMIFKANRNGHVKSWLELYCNRRKECKLEFLIQDIKDFIQEQKGRLNAEI